MTASEKILRGIKLNSVVSPHADSAAEGGDVMANPTYLRQSSALINEALQKGYDVLQLANGDIVTTGTKIVVTQYAWDPQTGKLVKSKSSTQSRTRRGRRSMIKEDEEQFEEL